MRRFVIVAIASLLIVSCWSKETDDPNKAFTYWAQFKPNNDFEIINGRYYQSPHFTLEYEVFLQFRPPADWWQKLVEQRHLVKDQAEGWIPPTHAPNWFRPSTDVLRLKQSDPTDFNRSRYFINISTGECFIYETLGM